jgi:hypothetical protein
MYVQAARTLGVADCEFWSGNKSRSENKIKKKQQIIFFKIAEL